MAKHSEVKVQKERLTIYLMPDAAKNLKTHAVHMGLDYSDLVEKLITEHLTKYKVTVSK